MMKQSGQVVMILMLIMVVSLAIGLAIVGHSISDISTSSKTESSTRAYFAAESGIERVMAYPTPTPSGTLSVNTLTNNATATVTWNNLAPSGVGFNGNAMALGFPAFGKESFAHFWLANPTNLSQVYNTGNFDIYFGVARDYTADPNNKPAIEVHVVLNNGSNGYISRKFFFDSFNGTSPGRNNNGFAGCKNLSISGLTIPINDNSTVQSYYCQVNVKYSDPSDGAGVYPALVRVRILYSNNAHPVALQPTSTTALPAQAALYTSTGVSGNTTRSLQVFKQQYVVPYFFDYVLFSSANLQK